MIRSFRCADTESLFNGYGVKRFQSFERPARRKLLYLNQARKLDDLRTPPGNQLKLIKGNRAGTYSIRINDQWRLCFTWQDGDAYNVEIIDYH